MKHHTIIRKALAVVERCSVWVYKTESMVSLTGVVPSITAGLPLTGRSAGGRK